MTMSDALTAQLILVAAFAAAAFAALGLVFAILAFAAARRVAPSAVTREEAQSLLRQEGDAIRTASEATTGRLRQEIGQTLSAYHSEIVDRVVKSSDTLRDTIEARLDAATAGQGHAAHVLREELNGSFQHMRRGVGEVLTQMSEHQKERLDHTQRELKALTEASKSGAEQLRASVEQRLDALRAENTAKLEEVRLTVDEKLQTTLEARLGESFKSVVEQLNKAYEVFGEMRTISANVGDLKNVLTNPKLRGSFGEAQLAMLVEDYLSPTQFVKDAQVREHSGERVEYAIRLPTTDGDDILLPIDAKFPREDHEHMIAALEKGDVLLAEQFRRALENRIKAFAKDIAKKYINPPVTTERAILFLPTESLFAEVMRQPGLFEYASRECGVTIAGPTTFAAILHSFQVGHRSMAIARQSGEVWRVLSAVRSEFRKYNDTVGRVAKQLRTVTNSVDDLGKRTRQMDKALGKVETLPANVDGAALLGLSDMLPADDEDDIAVGVGEVALLEDARQAS